MREHLPVPQSRRGLLVAAVVLVAVLAGVVAGLLLAFVTMNGTGGGLARASYPGFNLSFRYPSGWRQRNWCWLANDLFPLTLLTTAPVAPTCHAISAYTQGTPLPPPQRIRRNGVAAWWLAANRAGSARFTANARVAGRPARITVQRESTLRTVHSYVNCVGAGSSQRFLQALIRGPSSNVSEVQLGAVICGPHFAAGEAKVRRMLASLRFTS